MGCTEEGGGCTEEGGGCTEEGGGCAGRGGGEMLLGEITDMHLGGLSLVSGWVSL